MIVFHAFYAPCKLIQKLIEIRGHEILFHNLKINLDLKVCYILRKAQEKAQESTYASETHDLQRVFRPGWGGG